MTEELVELDLAKDGAQGGLGELRGLVGVIGDLKDGERGVDNAQGDDGVDLDGDVVAGDDILRRHLHDFLAERDADELVQRAQDEEEAWAFGLWECAAEAEDDGALVFAKDVDAVEEIEAEDDDDDQWDEQHGG